MTTPSNPYPPPPPGQSDYPGGQGWNDGNFGEQQPPPPKKRAWWQRAGLLIRVGIVVFVVIAGLIGWLGSAKRDDSGAITEDGTIAATELRVGDCFNNPTGEEFSELTVLPCADAHDGEVFFIIDLVAATFPGDPEVQQTVEEQCLPAFGTYVGVPFQESKFDVNWFSPSQAAWDEGDRVLTCLVLDPDGEKLTGSARDSRL